jgi:thiosulfate reductase cytochrome b subunit
VIAGIGLTLVYTYYYPDRSTADIYKYFDDAQIIASTLPEHPQLYAELITGINDNDPQLESYVKQMKNWSAHSNQWLSYTQTRNFNIFNSNRIITRFNALLWPISLGNMYTHVLFMCFLSLCGLTALYRLSVNHIREKQLPLFIVIFLWPSVLFWCSGVLKDGLIISTLYFLLYVGLDKDKILKRKILYVLVIAGLITLLLITKYYVVLALIPAIIGMSIQGFRQSIKPLHAHALAIALCFIMMIGSSVVGFSPNGIDIIQAKREEALKAAILGDANHYLFVDNMENSAFGFIRKIPEALANGLFRPFLWETGNSPFIALTALENLVLILLIIGAIAFPDKKQLNDSKVWMLISFVLCLALIIGFTTPISGGIVRYKTAFIPAFCSALVLLIDFSKMGDRIHFTNKMNRLQKILFSKSEK